MSSAGPPRMRVRESGPHEADALLAVQRAASVAALPHVYPPDLYPYPDDAIRDRWLTFETARRLDELLRALLTEDIEVATAHFTDAA